MQIFLLIFYMRLENNNGDYILAVWTRYLPRCIMVRWKIKFVETPVKYAQNQLFYCNYSNSFSFYYYYCSFLFVAILIGADGILAFLQCVITLFLVLLLQITVNFNGGSRGRKTNRRAGDRVFWPNR